MITKKIYIIPLLLSCLFVTNVCFGQAKVDLSDPTQGYNTAAAAIEAKQWDKGLKAINAVLAKHSKDGKKKFGPVFGHFYYLKGLLHLGKKQYGEAKAAFKTCAEKYPTDKNAKINNDQPAPPNQFQYSALVQWGNVEMIQENWAEAASLFDRVLKEKPEDDTRINILIVTVNLGKSLIKSGKHKEGYNVLIPGLDPEKSVGQRTKQIIFMTLANDWSPHRKLPEVRDFVNKYRNVVDHDSEENRFERNPYFQILAQKALEKGDPIRSLIWYSLMVDPASRLAEIDRRIGRLERFDIAKRYANASEQQRASLEADRTRNLLELKKERTEIVENNRQLMNGTGVCYLQMMNYSASFAIFDRLSLEVPKNYKDRPLYLHNAVVSATQIGKWPEAYKHGKQFIDAYPDHELFPSVARVLVEVIFVRGEYERAYEISGEVRENMQIGADIRDIPDFINGASAYQIGKIDEAEFELESYIKNYPNRKRDEPAQFFLGLTKVRLFKWVEAAEKLNEFLKKYPDSSLVPDALYQCALSEFQIDRYDEALTKVELYRKKYPNHSSKGQVANLRGDIFATQGKEFEEIEPNYLEAKKFGYELGEQETSAYALWQLAIHTNDAKQFDKVAKIIEEFETKHATSVYRLDFIAASLPALAELGRKDEGLKKIKDAAYEFSDRPTSVELAEMFGSYFDYLKTHYEPEEIINELQNNNDKGLQIPAMKGWLLVALIDYTESQRQNEGDEPAANKYYYRLDSGFEPAKNSNFVIVKLARWLADFRKDTRKAREMYDYIINERPDSPDSNFAILDTARMLAKTDNSLDNKEAMKRFQRVLNEQTDSESLGLATLGIARLHTKNKDFAAAQKYWNTYRENNEWRGSKAEASYEAARCAEELGDKPKALVLYVNTYSSYEGHLDWSTKGYIGAARLSYEKGDVKSAYEILNDMLSRIGHHKHPGIDEGRKIFERYSAEYTPEESETENN